MNGPTSTLYYCITAAYSDGSGMPDVLLVTDDENLARAQLTMIERADPTKNLQIITPAAVILKSTTAPEGSPQ